MTHMATEHEPVPAGRPAPRQTLSYLRQLFDERGLRPKGKLGQNFLVDLNLLDLLVRSAEVGRHDLILEVGSGTGSLTARLSEHAGWVVSVEIDPAFHTLAGEAVADRPNVTMLHADVLRAKNELNPDVLAVLRERLQAAGCRRLKLVANLPYAVATPVIANSLLTDLPFERMVVTVQWEIAERFMARPGTKDYGALAVLVESLANVSLVRRLPPGVFWPRPQVSSAIILVRPDSAKRQHVGDPQRFRHFLRDLYTHRRQNLRGALVSLPRVQMGKPIREHPLVAEMLLDMQTTVAGLRALWMEAGVAYDLVQGFERRLHAMSEVDPERAGLERRKRRLERYLRELTPLVKWYGTEGAVRVCRLALQIHGGVGVVDEYDVGRFMRDALITPIYEGTSQIQSLMAVKDLMKATMQRPRSLLGRGPSRLLAEASFDGRVGSDFAAARGNIVGVLRSLMGGLVRRKGPGLLRGAALADEDLGPILLHAERITEALAHTHVARVLAERFPDTAETEPELLAHHCTEAGLMEEAIGWWQRAGTGAAEHSACHEAVAHLTRGVELLRALPPTPERRRQELDLQLALGPVLLAGIGELFRGSGLTGWEEPLAAFEAQCAEYARFVETAVLPRARSDHRLPPEIYAFLLRHVGVDIAPGELAARAHAAFDAIQAEMQQLAPEVRNHEPSIALTSSAKRIAFDSYQPSFMAYVVRMRSIVSAPNASSTLRPTVTKFFPSRTVGPGLISAAGKTIGEITTMGVAGFFSRMVSRKACTAG